MKKSTVIPGLWLPTDVVDGPGWIDVEICWICPTTSVNTQHSLHERTQPQNTD